MEGEREASIVEAKAAVRLAPDYAEAQALLGILLRHVGRNAEAIEALQAAWRLSPPSVAAGLELAAWELNHRDRPEEAERILEVCQIYQPGDSRVLLLQAEALERAGKLVQAEKHGEPRRPRSRRSRRSFTASLGHQRRVGESEFGEIFSGTGQTNQSL